MTGVPHFDLRSDALSIWRVALAAVAPVELMRRFIDDRGRDLMPIFAQAPRIIVVGGGKAAGAMAAALETILFCHLDRIEGAVNVPADCVRPLQRIHMHAARPAGTNEPTPEGVVGSHRILGLVAGARPEDVVVGVFSGGGSALLPLPPDGVELQDERELTQLLHRSGATITEMNAVRKHLSRLKGGQLAQVCRARHFFSLIISDVIGDPLDVIASGPTAPDPTTFADALQVLKRYDLLNRASPRIVRFLNLGASGRFAESCKSLPENVQNFVIGNNARALAAAAAEACRLGYTVLNLGSFIAGETCEVAQVFAGVVRSIRSDRQPAAPPVCVLCGGETTVTLPERHGCGGRNQEFVLAVFTTLQSQGMHDIAILSAGTDGEDGPTDAAGAIADERTLQICRRLSLNPESALANHDAYPFFAATGDLIKIGLTQTNVMDIRLILMR